MFDTHIYARDTTTHPRFPPTKNQPCVAAYKQILVILGKTESVPFCLVVDHPSCASPTTGSMTAVELSLNQLSIDVGVREGSFHMEAQIFESRNGS